MEFLQSRPAVISITEEIRLEWKANRGSEADRAFVAFVDSEKAARIRFRPHGVAVHILEISTFEGFDGHSLERLLINHLLARHRHTLFLVTPEIERLPWFDALVSETHTSHALARARKELKEFDLACAKAERDIKEVYARNASHAERLAVYADFPLYLRREEHRQMLVDTAISLSRFAYSFKAFRHREPGAKAL